MRMRHLMVAAALSGTCVSVACVSGARAADAPPDPLRASYYDAFKGKKIVFVVMSMGMDIDQGWMGLVNAQARELGYQVEVRDSNWKPDAGAQALSSVIAEKPDIIMV